MKINYILIKDLINSDFHIDKDDDNELCELVVNYPQYTILLVTPKMRSKISNLVDCKYAEISGFPIYSDKVILVWENSQNGKEYLIMTASDMERFGCAK